MGGPISQGFMLSTTRLEWAKGSGTNENCTFESCEKAILFANLEASVLLLG